MAGEIIDVSVVVVAVTESVFEVVVMTGAGDKADLTRRSISLP